MMKKTLHYLLFCLTAFSVNAQHFSRKAPAMINSYIYLSAHSFIGAEANFSGIGNVNLLEGPDSDIDYYTQTGYINFVEDVDDPTKLSEWTADYTFFVNSSNATSVDGYLSSVELYNYTAAAPEYEMSSVEADDSASTGWEVAYQYDFKKDPDQKFVFGFMVGFGFDHVEFTYSNRFEDSVPLMGVTLLVEGLEELDRPIPYSEGLLIGGDYAIHKDNINDSNFYDPVPVIGDNDVLVMSDMYLDYELDTSILYFRAGPTFKCNVFDNLRVMLSAGAFLSYVDNSFDFLEILYDETYVPNQIEEEGSASYSDFIMGGYAELQLQFDLNQRTAFYITYQQNISQDIDPEEIGEIEVDVDVDNTSKVGAGFVIKY